MTVPDDLIGGNHAEIARYRREQAQARTAERRPDLLRGIEPGDRRQ
jgi:tRNA (guanine37-N1)-methyltransferase